MLQKNTCVLDENILYECAKLSPREHLYARLSLCLPPCPIGVENAITQEVLERSGQLHPFDIVIEIVLQNVLDIFR